MPDRILSHALDCYRQAAVAIGEAILLLHASNQDEVEPVIDRLRELHKQVEEMEKR